MKKLILIILTCLPFYIYSQINIDSALVAYYPFSGNANDASGNGNDGTVYGATLTTDRFGNPNSAYSFNGSGDYIEIPVNINFNALPELTMVAWVSPSNIPSNPKKTIISHDDAGFDRTMIIDYRGATTGYSAFKGNGVFGAFPATVGQWDMITVAYDQTTHTVNLYKDTTSMTGNTSFGSGWNYTWIGGNPSHGEYFDGVIDEVRLYDRILTDDEIKVLFELTYSVFTVSDDSICEEDTVTYTDQTLGTVVSWDWTFEGGTPGTSTAQNPSVIYNTAGYYDVQLIVSNGVYSDTLLEEDYILVSDIPTQPNTPSGPTETCEGCSYDYTTDSIAWAISYEWMLEPSDAGTMSGSGTTGTYTAASGWTGAYSVNVRASNYCGLSVWSDTIAANLNHQPLVFSLIGEGAYCEGDPGSEIILDGSETGVDYELFKDNVTTGVIIAGTGDSISFGYFQETGIYSIEGFTDHCTEVMIGQIYVHMVSMPGQAATPTGPEMVCGSDTSEYVTAGAPDADSFIWILSPTEAGTMMPNYDTVDIIWNADFNGIAFLSVYGTNDCGDGPTSDELEITVLLAPDPEISGLDSVCCGFTEDYMTIENPGNTYEWEVSCGTIISGAGTHQISVLWCDPGSGYVMVTEDNGTCSTSTEQFEVVIEEGTGIGDHELHKLKVYPNPAKNVLNIDLGSIRELKDGLISLINIQGHVINSLKVTEVLRNIRIDISDVAPGLYYVQIIEDDQIIGVRKVVIVR